MAPATYHRPDDIDLRSLWQSAARSLPRLALMAGLAAAATYGVLSLMAPRYMSETQLAIESKSANNPFTDPSRNGANDSVSVRMDKEAINTHVRALMSMDLGEEIVRDMKLADRSEFNSAKGSPDTLSALLRVVGIGAPRKSESDQARALEAYFKRLEVYSPKESRFIGVRFSSIDPELAAAVANRIAETYRQNIAHQSLVETDEVQKALEPKIAKLADEAAAAEAAVEKFRGEANIFKGGQQATGLNEQQLAELNAELSRVKATRSEAEARAKQAREMQELGSAETLADIQKSPLIQNLVQSRVRVERQISELSATLLPGHPRMRQLTADLKGLKSQIAAEVAKIVDGLGKEARVAALREEAIQKSVADIKSRIVTAGPEEAKLRSLEADAKSKRAELDRLRAQFEANRVRADDSRTIPVEAQIVSSARPSAVPVFPRKGATALLVALATMMIGLALVITRGLLGGARVASGAARPQAERRRERHQPMLPIPQRRMAQAHHPLLEELPDEPAQDPLPEPAAFEPTEPARAVEALAEPVQSAEIDVAAEPEVASNAGEPGEANLSADPEPAHGPDVAHIAAADDLAARIVALHTGGTSGTRTLLTGSDNLFALAREATAVGRSIANKGHTVIMVDWNLSGEGISSRMDQPTWPGFNELIDGRARFEDVVRSLDDSDVHLIPCGRGLDSPEEPLDSDSISFLLDALDDVYEHILVVARTRPAQRLFEAIQGRFDCGVMLVADDEEKARAEADGASMFLGFEVEGIELLTFDHSDLRRERRKLARVG
ncbi:MAG: lipopolysaccharide biosynthesis protein [Rhizobiales bacterium]|nr:lipopolysaccharide biosynthesis protein [Hyphomicrobiales bacterium]